MSRENRSAGFGKQFSLFAVAVAAIAVWAVMPFILRSVTTTTHAQNGTVPTLTASLSAGGPSVLWGFAFYGPTNAADRVLRVEAYNLNQVANPLPFRVFLNNAEIGVLTFTPSTNYAVLFLTTANGGTVPFVVAGDRVSIQNGNSVFLSGVFAPPASPTPNVSPTPTPVASPTPVLSTHLWAPLAGPPIDGITPRGLGQYHSTSNFRSLNVFVSYVNLPENTSLGVVVDGAAVGNIVLHDHQGQYACGNTATPVACPVVSSGSSLVVRNGNATILSGTFSNTPPTGSPTPTPSVTPTPNPPVPPFTFRANLMGSSVVPPVATEGTGLGLIKLVPSTVANTFSRIAVILTYQNLSSAVTAATINGPAMPGENGPVIFTLANNPTPIPGTVTGIQFFNLNAEQLMQLRAGLWYFNVATTNHPAGEIRGQIRSANHRSDFDGDAVADIGVVRGLGDAPANAANQWYVLNSGDHTVMTLAMGSPGDINVQGDYDGDGIADISMFTPSTGVWQIRRSNTGETANITWGMNGDRPVVGDYDGDGLNDPAVFRPSNGHWYILRSTDGGYNVIGWGLEGDRPVSGDYDGDGKNDLAVFRPSNGHWYILRSSGGAYSIMHWGMTGDRPVSGDFDGDGMSDIAVYRPADGTWYIRKSSNGTFLAYGFGISEDIPVACGFDADGITDIAVFRPSTGHWYIRRSTDGGFTAYPFGIATDNPLSSIY